MIGIGVRDEPEKVFVGTGGARIVSMESAYSFTCAGEERSVLPRLSVGGVFVSKPSDPVDDHVRLISTIPFGVHHFGDFVYFVAVFGDLDRARRRLSAIRNVVRRRKFKLGDVENRMNAFEVGGEPELVHLVGDLGDDQERTKIFLGEFPCRSGRRDVLGKDVRHIAGIELRRCGPAGVSGAGVCSYGLGELLLECDLELVYVDYQITGTSGGGVALGVESDRGVVTLVREERRDSGGVVRSVVVDELGKGDEIGPVVLVVVAVNAEVLF
jgi:hypothetical protein